MDQWVSHTVKHAGAKRTNWLPCVQATVGFMLLLNMLSCFDRADYVTSVAGVMAIFFLNDTSGLNRNKFRALPVLLLFSLVYDFLWIFLLNDREKEGKATEKGLESSIISFSIYVSYANMFFKVSINLLI